MFPLKSRFGRFGGEKEKNLFRGFEGVEDTGKESGGWQRSSAHPYDRHQFSNLGERFPELSSA